MESDPVPDLDPDIDDLPLKANINHMLVRHYVLDLAVHFERKVIGGSIVLFLEPVRSGRKSNTSEEDISLLSTPKDDESPPITGPKQFISSDVGAGSDIGDVLWDVDSDDFTLVLDCCDLVVFRVEEVDVTTVSDLKELDKQEFYANVDHPSSSLVQRLVSMPSACWKKQQDLYLQCSSSPVALHAKPLRFQMDRWSLQIRKEGVSSPHAFPCALRIWYETKPAGGSVRWTRDQDGRCCVYTMGSPINNRALFPCQEPPVAMSTWQARVRAPCDYTVLMSGEHQAFPEPAETGVLHWDYYVTMPMPASTFTIAVGCWLEAGLKPSNSVVEKTEDPQFQVPIVSLNSYQSGLTDKHQKNLTSDQEGDKQNVCSHMDYPCRFMVSDARTQTVIPHRVYASALHLQRAEDMVLPLLPLCLTAAYFILGVHPFSRLDVLIVPSGFSSLGMARSYLHRKNTGSYEVIHSPSAEKQQGSCLKHNMCSSHWLHHLICIYDHF